MFPLLTICNAAIVTMAVENLRKKIKLLIKKNFGTFFSFSVSIRDIFIFKKAIDSSEKTNGQPNLPLLAL